ncbi:MAG TPA: response regulator transcription factor [Burkholderiales bacterium]
MNPIRIVLADDHDLVRAGIRSLVQGIEGLEVVGEAGDGREALRLVKVHQPDVVLMDIAMPGLNGLDATARIAKAFPKSAVIILSMHATREYVLEALKAGASGYVLKNAAVDELEAAIRTVARGGKYITSSVSGHIVSGVTGLPETAPTAALTQRQREILQLIAEGRSTREIGALLHISVKTVETHRAQLMDRLGIYDVAGLVRYAIRVGLVTPDR